MRAILGNSVASDYVMSIMNQLAVNMLCDILGVNDLGVHDVENEAIELFDGSRGIIFLDFPVDKTTIELRNLMNQRIDDDIEYRAGSHTDDLFFIIHKPTGNQTTLWRREGAVLANYTAGYKLKETIKFDANPNNADTITIKSVGVEKTYTFKTSPTGEEIQRGATIADSVQNLANAIVGATADDDTITLPIGHEYTTGDFTVTVEIANIPSDLKFLCAYICGGLLMGMEKVGGVVSYRLGDKQVNFRNMTEANVSEQLLSGYAGRFNKIQIL